MVNLIRDLDTDFSILGKNYINVIQVSAHLLAMSSACYNPFIYASLHNKFLSYLCLHFLSRRRGKGKDRGQGSSILTVSHRMPHNHISTVVADLPVVVMNDTVPRENYGWVISHSITRNILTSWCFIQLSCMKITVCASSFHQIWHEPCLLLNDRQVQWKNK